MPIVNRQAGWWEATHTCAKKGGNEFSVGNSEENIRKHLDAPSGHRSETDPSLLSGCDTVFLPAPAPGSGTVRLGNQGGDAWGSGSRTVDTIHTLTHHTRSQAGTRANAFDTYTEVCTYKCILHPPTHIAPPTQAHANSHTLPLMHAHRT